MTKRSPGQAAAYAYGTEAQANGALFYEYQDDIADAYGYERWGMMPVTLRREARAAYNEGKAAEKKLQEEK